MRSTLFFVLGLAATSLAMPGGFEPAGELAHPLLPKSIKRGASAANVLQSREISGGFIAALPKDAGEPAEGSDGANKRRRRFLTKDEVVVPDTLRDHEKRAIYCKNSGYGLCPNLDYCCPLGGLCCSNGGCCRKGQRCCSFEGCCPSSSNCVIVDGQEGCCPIGKICSATGSQCATTGYVKCANYNFCCKPGYTCYRASDGTNLCRAPSSGGNDNNYDTTTTKRTTTTSTTPAVVYTPTTIDISQDTTTDVMAQPTGTTTTPFAFPTTTPAAFNTSTTPRTTSSVEIPITNANGAMRISSFSTSGVLISAALLAVGQVFIA